MASTSVERPTINRLFRAAYPSIALMAGMQLDVFTALGDGPRTADEVARTLDVPAAHLAHLLYALVVADLLTVDDGRFANTVEADVYLVQGRPGFLKGLADLLEDGLSASLHTATTIRTGVPQARHDFSEMSKEEQEVFLRSLHAGAVGEGRALAKRFDFGRFTALLDVGGGTGGAAIACCEACPNLHATVAELAAVTPITQQVIHEEGASERVSVLGIDMTRDRPETVFDVAILRAFIQVLPAEAASAALVNVGQALRPEGEVYIIGAVLDDSRLSPPDLVTSNLFFLNKFDGGQAYTEGTYRAWLEAGGFGQFERNVGADGRSTLRAVKQP